MVGVGVQRWTHQKLHINELLLTLSIATCVLQAICTPSPQRYNLISIGSVFYLKTETAQSSLFSLSGFQSHHPIILLGQQRWSTLLKLVWNLRWHLSPTHKLKPCYLTTMKRRRGRGTYDMKYTSLHGCVATAWISQQVQGNITAFVKLSLYCQEEHARHEAV
jgi:hypothetical protein